MKWLATDLFYPAWVNDQPKGKHMSGISELVFQVALPVTLVLFVLLGMTFWVWMLIDCVTRESNEGNERIVWVLILLFTHVIGAAIYYFVRRPRRFVEAGN